MFYIFCHRAKLDPQQEGLTDQHNMRNIIIDIYIPYSLKFGGLLEKKVEIEIGGY